ncbi:hypothetical protein HDE_12030 [Halotydeus destructor]|nr:hypothetical protein HDE_12030 [Halotydeus destructor]
MFPRAIPPEESSKERCDRDHDTKSPLDLRMPLDRKYPGSLSDEEKVNSKEKKDKLLSNLNKYNPSYKVK